MMTLRRFLKNMENPIPESRVSTFRKPFKIQFVFCLLFSAVCFLSACGPRYTFPSSTVPKAIEDICKKEYKIDVTARVVGKTVWALVYIDSVVDAKGQVPKEVNEVMGKVMLVVSRVALSTDLPVDFCTVLVRDKTH